MSRKDIFSKKIPIIKEIANTIITTEHVDAIANFILAQALEHTNAKKGSIMLLDENDTLVVKAVKGLDTAVLPSLKVKLGEKICGKVAKDKNALLVKDIKNDKRFKKEGNGRYKTNSFICSPILMKGRVLGVINISDKIDGNPFTEEDLDMIDILSCQMAISLEYLNLRDEFRSITQELNERSKILLESEQLKIEFITEISHKLRTPLNSITGAVYYLKEKDGLKKEQAEFIDIISDETRKMITHLDNLLNFSYLEKEGFYEKRVLNLKEILEGILESKVLKDILLKNQLSMNIKYPDYTLNIIGAKIRLIQTFIYLIDGITAYTTPGDIIEIQAEDKGETVEIILFIKGKNILQTELPLLFNDPSLLLGVDPTKGRIKLYLAQRTIELHKGTIALSSSVKGLKMSFFFPKTSRDYREAMTNELADLLLCYAAETMDVKRCSLMLCDELTGNLIIKSAIGLDIEAIMETELKIGEGIAGVVAKVKEPLLIQDIETDPRIRKKNSKQYNTKSFLCLPLLVNNRVVGILNLNNKSSSRIFSKKDLLLAMVVAERISKILEKGQRGELTTREFKKITGNIKSFLNAIKLYNKRHYEPLTDLVIGITENIGCTEDEIGLALYASTIYDIGLTQIDQNILMKSSKLSDIEQKIIRTHPFPGVALIYHFESDHTVIETILHHHERYDGSGYPYGLKGDNVPFLSRVIAVVDAYSAMISDRPYRKAFSSRKALEQIKAGAGTHYDPRVVETLTQLLNMPSLSPHLSGSKILNI
jgi:hypothetical protein